MRGAVARRIRRKVYGDMSIRQRSYQVTPVGTTITVDACRRAYCVLKRAYTRKQVKPGSL